MTPELVQQLLVAGLGLAVGSFLNVCIHRVPARQSVVSPGSRCPGCGAAIAWFDNVPVVSYALLRGRCRHCGIGISARYPLVELTTMVVFLWHLALIGFQPLLVPRLILASILIVLFAVDLEHRLLHNVITLPGMVVGFAFSLVLPPGPVDSLLGVLVGGGFLWLVGEAYYRFAGREGMGGGDVKMLAMIGAFLGWKLALLTLILSSILGAIVGVIVLARHRGGLQLELPYGTFLSVAALTASLYGDRIVSWYVGLYVVP